MQKRRELRADDNGKKMEGKKINGRLAGSRRRVRRE